METPAQFSVVVVVLEGVGRLEHCLGALLSQEHAPSMEILIPWDGTHGSSQLVASRFPQAQFLPVSGGRRTYAELRAIGVQAARGAIIAITEDHCAPRPDWCAQILAAHQAGHAGIGGAVEKETPDRALNWSFYFADYLRYLDPPDGPSVHLTDCNVTYKRAALEAIAGVWRREFHENQVHEALLARGESLWLSPRIVVRQKRDLTLSAALWDRYAFGRLFAATRVEGTSFSRRLTLLAASLVLPVLLVARIASHIRRTRRYRAEFLRALPLVLLISATWAFGELLGYLTGTPEKTLKTKSRVVAT